MRAFMTTLLIMVIGIQAHIASRPALPVPHVTIIDLPDASSHSMTRGTFTATREDVQCMAENIYHEARGEPRDGRIAVALVTLNRVRAAQFPDDICSVVYEKRRGKCQFSWACQDRKIRETNAWEKSKQLARRIIHQYDSEEFVLDLLPADVVYFHSTRVHPVWAKDMQRVSTIGKHIFYREG